MKVALGAARGLAFLHSSEVKVIYRDFKTANILLDSNYNAKLSDFGLAKDGPTGDQSHVSTRVMGTYGYAAPEYIATVDKNRPPGEQSLVEWAKPYMANKRKVFRMLDSRLEGQYAMEDAQKASVLALQCLSMDMKFRPNMDKVVATLEQLQAPEGSEACKSKLGNPNPPRARSHSIESTRSRNQSVPYPRPSTSPLFA
ncbi:hypothetical protein SAY86_019105 [Trapa natans]|uniref:Protein kinase domain-containing protein n=1 Tax=Trapa natans TaxID=22666 RepID=A0AAN7LDW0_TRANT|nr:hypothetical protein SAY86_019105 [Trapa natans]